MPANVQILIVPAKPRTVAPGDLAWHTFANRSTFPPMRLLQDVDLRWGAPIVNLSTFGTDRIVEDAFAEVNLLDSVFTNVSTFGTETLAEAPPDVTLRDAVFTNVSTFGSETLAEAPPDEILRDTVFSNVSTFGAETIERDNSASASIAGSSTVAFVGRSTAAAAASIAGTSTVAATATGVAPAAASIAGSSTVLFTAFQDDEDGTMALISTQTASNSASLDFTGLTGTSWKLIGRLLIPATDGTSIKILLGTGGGPTFATTNYKSSFNGYDTSGGYSAFAAESASGITIMTNIHNATPGLMIFECEIVTDNANWASVSGTFGGLDTAGVHQNFGSFGGSWPTSAQITGVRVIANTGNLTSGNASLYSIST